MADGSRSRDVYFGISAGPTFYGDTAPIAMAHGCTLAEQCDLPPGTPWASRVSEWPAAAHLATLRAEIGPHMRSSVG
ncbi:MAG: hypothetical protein JO081_15070 [Alphaproteobacteria bacterium]|nr:hypothetical protein [Alphaproteobacteria bacterium]